LAWSLIATGGEINGDANWANHAILEDAIAPCPNRLVVEFQMDAKKAIRLRTCTRRLLCWRNEGRKKETAGKMVLIAWAGPLRPGIRWPISVTVRNCHKSTIKLSNNL
jgi:hypothetical protein